MLIWKTRLGQAVRGKSLPRPFSAWVPPENAEGFWRCRLPHCAAADYSHCLLALLLVGLCAASGLGADGVGTKKVVPVPRDVHPEQMPGSRPRNVVFILSDDHRYDAMSFLGHQFAETPHLDSLAANGVHFKNAFVTTSLCSPSRASILTGLYTFRHRVIDNNRLVPDGTIFFPQYLQKAEQRHVARQVLIHS